MVVGRRRKPKQFFFFKSSWINEEHFLFLLLQLYFLCKITNIFSNGILNHGYAILSNIITNTYKLVV